MRPQTQINVQVRHANHMSWLDLIRFRRRTDLAGLRSVGIRAMAPSVGFTFPKEAPTRTYLSGTATTLSAVWKPFELKAPNISCCRPRPSGGSIVIKNFANIWRPITQLLCGMRIRVLFLICAGPQLYPTNLRQRTQPRLQPFDQGKDRRTSTLSSKSKTPPNATPLASATVNNLLFSAAT